MRQTDDGVPFLWGPVLLGRNGGGQPGMKNLCVFVWWATTAVGNSFEQSNAIIIQGCIYAHYSCF